MDNWRVWVDETRPVAAQMPFDEQLAAERRLTARFFLWKSPTMSLGWKQPDPVWLSRPRWRAAGLEVVERPTGGGIAFHGSDISISVVVPHALDLPLASLMRSICQSAVRLCGTFGVEAAPLLGAGQGERITYCLTQESPYAVLVGERKVAGFAIRRYPQSWLIQGSLLVRPLHPALGENMPEEITAALRARALSLAEAAQAPLNELAAAQRWAQHWTSWLAPFEFSETLRV